MTSAMAHLIFLTSTPPNIAEGSGTWVGISVLRDAIVALGHEVTLVAPPPSEHVTTLSRLMFNLQARSRLDRLNADALIGFDLDGVFVRTPRLLHIAAIKGVLADEARFEHGRNRFALAIQARLEARHVRRADRIIATSRYSSERIARFYGVSPSQIFIVPELIELQAWEAALRSAPREEGPLRVLCVAHLYSRKGIDTLLEAFARLKGAAILRIVGIGPESRRLERLARSLAISDRVQFLGQLSFRALIAEYRNASVFALPTSQEGFGIVFLEAMAASLPIVAGDAAAVPEVVRDGVTGILVKPHDCEAFARALQLLLDQPETRKAMGAAGCAEVRRYDAPIIARAFLGAVDIHVPTPMQTALAAEKIAGGKEK
jgi:glycosyltransferase involved in cell wall biosynthesis